MKRSSDVLHEEFIYLGLMAGRKEEAIREMIGRGSAADVLTDEEQFFKAVMARKQLQSTGIGGGVAIPHARSEGVRRLTVVLRRFRGGRGFRCPGWQTGAACLFDCGS